MISFKGYENSVLTFRGNSSIPEGVPVSLNNDGSLKQAGSGDEIIGVLSKNHGGMCAVQVKGYVELPYLASAAPSCGVCRLCANGDGSVKTKADGLVAYKVLKVDTVKKIVGFIL